MLFWSSFEFMKEVGPAPEMGFSEAWYGIVSIAGLAGTLATVIILMVWAYNDNNY